MLSFKKYDTYSQFLSRLKSQSKVSDIHTKAERTYGQRTKPVTRHGKNRVFTEGISSYSRRQEYTIYQQKDAFLPAANLLSGTKVSREKDNSVLIKRTPQQVHGAITEKTSPGLESILEMKMPVIQPVPKKINEMRPTSMTIMRPGDDCNENEKACSRGVEKTVGTKNESVRKSSKEITSKMTKLNNKRNKPITTGKLMKIPLFQTITKRNPVPLSCELSYDVNDVQVRQHSRGGGLRSRGNFNKLNPIFHHPSKMYEASYAEQPVENHHWGYAKGYYVPPPTAN